ncbi:MAG: type II toxin-antitoxin system RelE/ParE family toxin [Candidatus Dependentiae bacterium]
MSKSYIVYEGEQFTIEWYFDSRGTSRAREYFNELSHDRKNKFSYLLFLLANRGKIFNQEKFRYEGDQIYALKPTPDRFLCFFYDGSKIIITNAYEKKTAKMPVREKERALKAKADYIKRCQGGTYYD